MLAPFGYPLPAAFIPGDDRDLADEVGILRELKRTPPWRSGVRSCFIGSIADYSLSFIQRDGQHGPPILSAAYLPTVLNGGAPYEFGTPSAWVDWLLTLEVHGWSAQEVVQVRRFVRPH